MNVVPKSYSLCLAYDVLMQVKTLFLFDDGAKALTEELIDYLGEKLGVYTGEKIDADFAVMFLDTDGNITDESVLLPLLRN